VPPISGRLIRSRRLMLDSVKTYGNLVLEAACQKTDDFPGPVRAALIGGLMAFPENVRVSEKRQLAYVPSCVSTMPSGYMSWTQFPNSSST
jgi:hypothetical protein